MNRIYKNLAKALCAFLLGVSYNLAMAQKWEWVHRNFWQDYYVDPTSIKRTGDKVTATTLTDAACETPINGNFEKTASSFVRTVEFDCLDGSSKYLKQTMRNKKAEIVFEENKSEEKFKKIRTGGGAAIAGKVCQKFFSSSVDDLQRDAIVPFSQRCVVAGYDTDNKLADGRIIKMIYLDLSRLQSVDGKVVAWTQAAHEKPQSTTGKQEKYLTVIENHQIDCSTKQSFMLKNYFFNKEDIQIKSWQASPDTSVYATPKNDEGPMVVIIEEACRNASTLASSPATPSRPSTPAARSTAKTTGTAFAVSKNYFVTNAHVVENCVATKVGGSNSSVKAVDLRSDLALLSVNSTGEVARLRAGRLRQGEAVTVVGFPLNGILASGAQVTTGNVSALAGMGNDSRFIQISAPVQPGNSGGPLVDSSGNIVGVVVSKLNAIKMASITGDIPQNINFAISPFVLQAFLEANNVDYQTAASTKNLSIADVADMAKKYTSLVECFK